MEDPLLQIFFRLGPGIFAGLDFFPDPVYISIPEGPAGGGDPGAHPECITGGCYSSEQPLM